ncbi:hypothetical protein QZH41_011823 [Actinostola sp. cb2023]|nr:hypothetical protein QZH41_011823 [Actinostola sp. cb2023]
MGNPNHNVIQWWLDILPFCAVIERKTRISSSKYSSIQLHQTYPSPYWDTVSEPARNLIKKMLVIDPQQRIDARQALHHEWVRDPDEIPGSKINRRNTLVRLTAFNARRKLRGVVLGLIARKRMTFKPSSNVRRLTRRDSYVPDQDADLESRVQQLMASENEKLTSITEETSRQAHDGKYNMKEIKPQRSHTYRTSVQLDINPAKNNLRSIRSERRRSQKRAKETAACEETG